MKKQKLYYAVEGGKYVNYLSLLTDNPVRLPDIQIVKNGNVSQRVNNRHIIYTEKEAYRLLKINKKCDILEVFN